MRLILLTVIGLMAGLGLAAAIVVPVMAEKGPLRATLVAHLGGGQDEVPGGGDLNGRGRAVVKVFKEQLCAKVKTGAIESSSKATINLGMSGEVGPTVANLQERAATTLSESTTPRRRRLPRALQRQPPALPLPPRVLRAQPRVLRVLRRQPPAQLLPPRAPRVRKQGRPPQAIAHYPRLLLRRAPRWGRRASPSPPPPRRLVHQLAHRLAHRRLAHRRLAHRRLAHRRLAHRGLPPSSTLVAVWRCLGH